MSKKVIEIKDEELWKEIKITAIKEGMNLSEWIEAVLREAVSK